MCVCVCMCVYMYECICIYVYVYVYTKLWYQVNITYIVIMHRCKNNLTNFMS